MISALDEFRAVIATLPTGPLAAGLVTHPRISVYAATAVEAEIVAVQAMVAAIAGGAWATPVAAVDADLRLYELAVEAPCTALAEDEVANLISYGMTTVEPGVDLLGLAGMGAGGIFHKKAQYFSTSPSRERTTPVLAPQGPRRGKVRAAAAGVCEAVDTELDPRHSPSPTPLMAELCSTKAPLPSPPCGGEVSLGGLNELARTTRDTSALFGAIIAARMAGIRVVLAGDAACKARDLLQALHPAAVSHCLEAAPGSFEEVFGLTGAIARLQAAP